MKKRRKNKIILFIMDLKYAHKVIDTRQCDMVVLDEVLGLLDLGLLKTEELVEMLENRSDDQTIIMTGRQIPEALIPYADADILRSVRSKNLNVDAT